MTKWKLKWKKITSIIVCDCVWRSPSVLPRLDSTSFIVIEYTNKQQAENFVNICVPVGI